MIRWLMLIVALLLVYGAADAGMSVPRKLCSAETGGSCAGGTDGVLGNNAAIVADVDQGNASNPTLYWSVFTPTEDGSVSYCHYTVHYNDVGNSRCVLMDSSGNVLDYSAAQSPPGADRTTIHAAMTVGYCLETGISYKLGVWIDTDNYSGPAIAGDWGTGNTYYKSTSGMGWSATSFDLSSQTDLPNRSLYVTANNSADTP